MNFRRQLGFSLVEIMIAVAILAIISAIAIPLYQGHIAEARYGTAIKDIRQMELILDDLAGDNDLGALDADNETERGVFLDAAGNLTLGSNAATCPPPSNDPPPTPWCDPWASIYRYRRADNTTQDYDLRSQGPDNTSLTADDATK